ncbi:SRPBCC family protein [Corynebacterium timonense]|uniref:Polyketide cyclase / dehydrase and lipid transport n=1 Tax=Corynebacterium timonense TaxID=441500 RepID=A0A1H1TBW8_9CORY|nr:SRPBCC family protein [Corynebacterium timonense]SDS57561.1 Polyketide cyclase / dehydrase and lipid transport [Corynebacterium timonense]
MTETKNTVNRVIDAPADQIFDLLSNPERHPETDNSGMVASADQAERIKAVGDVFTMNMKNDDGDYQTRNEVFAFQENKVIGWKNLENITSNVTVGAKWLYELEPVDPDHTSVTLTYDRSELADDDLLPMTEKFDDDFLETSLDAVAAAVSGA